MLRSMVRSRQARKSSQKVIDQAHERANNGEKSAWDEVSWGFKIPMTQIYELTRMPKVIGIGVRTIQQHAFVSEEPFQKLRHTQKFIWAAEIQDATRYKVSGVKTGVHLLLQMCEWTGQITMKWSDRHAPF